MSMDHVTLDVVQVGQEANVKNVSTIYIDSLLILSDSENRKRKYAYYSKVIRNIF